MGFIRMGQVGIKLLRILIVGLLAAAVIIQRRLAEPASAAVHYRFGRPMLRDTGRELDRPWLVFIQLLQITVVD
ncbi:hypothetical protein D3C73_1495090 [compost metagenome]